MKFRRRSRQLSTQHKIQYEAVNAQTALVLEELRDLTERLRTTTAHLQQENGDV